MNIKNNIFPDHITQNDKAGIFVAAIFSVVALGGLIKATPPNSDRTARPVARVESIKNQVRYKDAGSVSFYETKPNEILQSNDEIFTAESAQAKIKFLKSNTVLVIPPSSLVRVEEDSNVESVEVKQGVVDIQMAKGQNIKIKAAGTSYLLTSTDDNNSIKVFTSGGKLQVFSKKGGIQVDGKQMGAEEFDLVTPEPGQRIEVEDGIKILVNRKGKYTVSLSRSADFTGEVFKTKYDGDSMFWKQALAEGEYYLKVEDKTGARVLPVSIVSKYKIDGMVPSGGDLVSLSPGEKTKLSWNPKPVYGYKVMVKDSLGSVKEYLTKSNELLVEHLRGSHFEWSVVPEIKKGKFQLVHSSAQAGLQFNGKIEFISSLRKKYRTTEKKINLNWKASSGERFLVKVEDIPGKKLILEREVQGLSYELPINDSGKFLLTIQSVDYPTFQKAESDFEVNKPVIEWSSDMKKELRSSDEGEPFELKYKIAENALNSFKIVGTYQGKEKSYNLDTSTSIKLEGFGDYCFKAVLLKNNAELTDSDEFCMKFIYLPPFPPLPRAADIIMNYDKHQGVESYKITVPQIAKAVKYRLEVFSDPSTKKLVYTAESKNSEVFWASNRSGVYYLKYRVIDQKNRMSDYSPVSKLIFPISPLSNW